MAAAIFLAILCFVSSFFLHHLFAVSLLIMVISLCLRLFLQPLWCTQMGKLSDLLIASTLTRGSGFQVMKVDKLQLSMDDLLQCTL
jgi:hypothetical protein